MVGDLGHQDVGAELLDLVADYLGDHVIRVLTNGRRVLRGLTNQRRALPGGPPGGRRQRVEEAEQRRVILHDVM